MIITVTLNAAIDKSLSVPNFRLGRRHRTVEQTTMPGGKGVNVARTLKALGQPVIATGFAGGPTGTRIVEQLTEESILNDFVRIREESRTNTAVYDPTNGATTEINERGPAVSAKEIELFRDKLLYLARGADVVVFAGSLPRGVEPAVYAQLIKELLHRVWIEPREAVAGVGAGDAFLAGFVAARYTGSPPAECLRFGVACGAESTQHLGAGLIDPREVERLLGEIDVELLDQPAEVG
jgi:fructose-1-phosphate kinase PfkB-like protein